MYLHELGILCALGDSHEQVLNRCLAGFRPQPQAVQELDLAIPALAWQGSLPSIPNKLHRYDCRNNRLLLAALAPIEEAVRSASTRYGSGRVGIVIGTSTSGIAEGEQALRQWHATGRMPESYDYRQQALGGAAQFLASYLDLDGPAYTVSTTCSSSAHALASARRLLRAGLCDAVIVGGADSLCRTTLEGFTALGAISKTLCNPFSQNRDGTLLGEGAALFLMTREPSPIALLGVGTSSDAYHISAPQPEGKGALLAMQQALQDADLTPAKVDYLNLHGTATLQNDRMEAKAVAALFNEGVLCSATKPATGHCLGAAGAIEAGLCWLILSGLNSQRRLPPQLWDGHQDGQLPSLSFVKLENPLGKPLQYCLSNSFAFGGNNVSLLIGRS